MSANLEEVKAKLLAGGYSGLYFPGECGCQASDLAPCGNCEQEPGEEWINGCEPGYKHICQKTGEFIIHKDAKVTQGQIEEVLGVTG